MWLTDIHKVVGPQERGLLGLLAGQQYQVYSPASTIAVELHFADWDVVARAFASDCARMSTATLETLEGNLQSDDLPKTVGWLLIRAYYGAFFAAHAIERMLGRSLTQLDTSAVNSINAVISVFGMQPSTGGLQRGLYVCVADGAKKTISLQKAVGDGSHESLWMDFVALLRLAITQILTQNNNSTTSQQAASKLTEIEMALTDSGNSSKGSWLSFIRNRVNYQHAFGVWFPYRNYPAYCDDLFEKMQLWRNDSSTISIWPRPGRELQRAVETSALIAALCREICVDMADRCPNGRSFHNFALINLLTRLGYK